MGMSNLANICRNLIDGGLAESTPAAVVYRGCTPDQKTVAATLGNLPQKVLDAGLANPAVIVVGKAVDLREKLSWFERLPLFGKRIVVTRRAPRPAAWLTIWPRLARRSSNALL